MKLVEMLKSELPEYSTKISSSDQAMCFRPFLVKEEKTLLTCIRRRKYDRHIKNS
jgi:hypothetical protein